MTLGDGFVLLLAVAAICLFTGLVEAAEGIAIRLARWWRERE